MTNFDMGEGLRKAFLAGVGAVALTAEKSQQVVDDFVKKGELTVEQGRALNAELTRKAKEAFDTTVSGASDAALRAKLEVMTPEERAAYAQKVTEMSAAIEADRAAAEEASEPEAAEDAADEPADGDEVAVEPDDAE